MEHREDHPPHKININIAFTQSKMSNWNWWELRAEQQKMIRGWEGLSYEARLKEQSASSLAEWQQRQDGHDNSL